MENLPLAPRKAQPLGPSPEIVTSGLPLGIPSWNEEPRSPAAFLLYWHFIRRWKWVLILFTVAGGLLGLAAGMMRPALYEARATMEIQGFNDTFLNMKQFLPINESDGAGNVYGDIQTQIKVLQSDSVVNRVAAQMPTMEKQNLPNLRPSVAPLKRALGLVPGPAEYVLNESRRLAKDLKVRAVGQTRIIEVTAESSNPQLAADFLNELCDEYMYQNIRSRYEMSQHTSQSLERLLDAERVKLRESENALQDYARTSGLIFTSANKNVAEEKLSQLQDELSKAEEARIGAQSRYETAKQVSPEGLPDELSQGSLREYKSKLTELRRQLAHFAETYTADYYKVKELEAEIATLQAAVRQEQKDVLQQAESRYREALRHENLLASSYTNQSAAVSELAQRAVQYNILEREAEGNRQSYDEMLKQVKEATVAAAVRADNVRVVDHASAPPYPSGPKRPLYCALGLLAGSAGGFLFAFIRQHTDCSLREPGEGLQYLGLTELGAVEHVHALSRRAKWLPALRTDPSEVSAQVMESYRAVVTSLLCETNGNRSHLFVVTSPGPNEGKTTVTVNLGRVLAGIGRRVVLVDGDTRKQRLHKIFGLNNERGLSTLLQAGRIYDHDLAQFVGRTSIAGLSVLPSGPLTKGCADLLHSPELPKLMSLLKEDFDFVLIDTPPVLPVADARVIGSFADGVVLVARARQTTRDAAEAARRRLGADGIRVVGMILNDWDPSSSAYTYYAEYARAYRELPGTKA
jgi:polysaccharide biosynthesis transport protein